MKDESKAKVQLVKELVELRQRVANIGEELAKNKAEWRSLVEIAGAGAATVNSKGELTFVDETLCRMIGYSKEELAGRHFVDFIHADDRMGLLNAFEDALLGRRHHPHLELRVICKDGHALWCNFSPYVVVQGNQPIGFSAIIRDINERKRTEEALIESERRYRLLAENVTDVIWTADLGLRLTYVSPSVTSMRGYSVEEAMAMAAEESMTPASAELVKKAFEEEVAVEEVGRGDPARSRMLEMEMYCKDGSTVWTEVKVTFLRDEEGRPVGVLGVTRDITERKRTRQRLQELYEQEKRVREEMEAETQKRAEFLRALAHELRTPLTPMLASSTMLAEELSEGPLGRLARNLREGTSNLGRRIDELLDLARGELRMLQLSPSSVDVVQLLRRIADEAAPMASRQSKSVAVETLSAIPLVWADADRLRQVVQNLLNNAFKSTPEGANITLRARKEEGGLVIEVEDNGVGMDEEQQRRLFEPYYRVESDRGSLSGLGLGLALCKTLVELHGGKIWVKSRRGEGSTFSFSLPLQSPSRAA